MTIIPAEPVCFSAWDAKEKQAQWTAMLRKNPDSPAPRDLDKALGDIWGVIKPIFDELNLGQSAGGA